MTILVTGGTGYIGSHTVVELLNAGQDVFIIDNLSNSKRSVLDRIEQITGRCPEFAELDIRDATGLRSLLRAHDFDAVIHFAGLKAVGESVTKPLLYYQNNITGSIAFFQELAKTTVRHIVFSSSATVYGDPHQLPIREDFPLNATNPYGRTKLMIEEILRDLAHSDSSWRIAILRYFNPVGAHISGLIGEDPNGIPNNLMPYIAQVAVKKLPILSVFGNDYLTPDGTGVRDYIHVIDLARGHLAALNSINVLPGVTTVNLGTGRGYSVLEMVQAFEIASGQKIPYQIVARRPGDIAICYADPTRAQQLLNWHSELGIVEMCADTWRWQQWARANLDI